MGYMDVPMKSIYVVENEHNEVRIGISQHASRRIKSLSKQGGFKAVNVYITKACSNSYEIKHLIHKELESYRIDGEWFRISFEDTVKLVNEIFEKKANLVLKKQRTIVPEDIDKMFGGA